MAALDLALENYLAFGCLLCSRTGTKIFSNFGSLAAGILPKARPADSRVQPASDWTLVETHDVNLSDYVDRATISACTALIEASWMRAFRRQDQNDREVWRIYVLPNDVWCDKIDRRNRRLRKFLCSLMPLIDISPAVWLGETRSPLPEDSSFDAYATKEESSLFYIFNTLPSPSPNPDRIREPNLRHAICRLLDSNSTPWGLKTHLHPYQRRAAAIMVQKEVASALQLDPRLEPRTNPLGEVFYYGPRDCVFWRSPRYYDTVRGGILAETMGLGKTLISLAAILATRGQTPTVPVQYSDQGTDHDGVLSLSNLAAAAVIRSKLPWKTLFEDEKDSSGNEHTHCLQIMRKQRPSYEVPPRIIRSMRHASIYGDSEKVLLCSGTIIVVPPNLVQQWENEIAKHVRKDALNVLVLKDMKTMVPLPEDLLQYDIVLFSRSRFEHENKQKDDLYESPLKALHWLRIIIDEGHSFSSSNTNAAVVADRLVKAERRWIMSGTPARDLLGVEVDTAGLTVSDDFDASQKYRSDTLQQRQYFDEAQERSSGAVKSIGALAAKYLKAQPWASTSDPGSDVVNWDDYIYRHEDSTARTYSFFSACLRSTLADLVVKTRPEDVEHDLKLPPLHHKVIRLKPSAIDKMTANLFVLLYTTNAVTSERRDRDYLFHSNSRQHLIRLTTNLRQSAFYWVGFTEESVLASIETAEKYLTKHEIDCSPDDRAMLMKTLDMARLIVGISVWKAGSKSQDMVLFLNEWLDGDNRSWLLDGSGALPTLGLNAGVQGQKYINNQLSSDDPMRGFAEAGVAAQIASEEEAAADSASNTGRKPETMARNGIPESSLSSLMGDKRLHVSGAARVSSKRPRKSLTSSNDVVASNGQPDQSKPKTNRKRKLSHGSSEIDLESNSALGSIHMIGSASAKFTYLVSRVHTLHKDEKILIFYEGGHIAYYLSQALDMLHIPHLIYANTLSSDLRSKYAVLFDTDPTHRVLIMDIKQAAHGLNLSSASRVFFVNPPNRPDVEAQAIKRAHRIGQTRPVFVETLVLSGTVEEAMHDRAAKMTKREHLAAKALEEDEGIRGIIQNATILPLSEEEMSAEGQGARFEEPLQLFGRPGRGRKKVVSLEKELFGAEETPKKKQKKLVIKFKLPGSRADLSPVAESGAQEQSSTQVSLFGG